MAKWDYWDDLRAKTLIKYLKSLPDGEYVNSSVLEEVCDIKDHPRHHERKIRNLITEIIKREPIPIVSGGSKGYKIATCQEEVNVNKKILFSTINSLKERMDRIQLNFDIYVKGKIESSTDLIESKPKRIELLIKPTQQPLFDKSVDYGMEV